MQRMSLFIPGHFVNAEKVLLIQISKNTLKIRTVRIIPMKKLCRAMSPPACLPRGTSGGVVVVVAMGEGEFVYGE